MTSALDYQLRSEERRDLINPIQTISFTTAWSTHPLMALVDQAVVNEIVCIGLIRS